MGDLEYEILIDEKDVGTLDISKISLTQIKTVKDPEPKIIKGFELEESLLTDATKNFYWIVINHGKKFVTSRELFLSKGIYYFAHKTVLLPLGEFGLNKARAFEQTLLNAV